MALTKIATGCMGPSKMQKIAPLVSEQQVPVVPVQSQQQVPVVPVLPQQQVPVVPVQPQQQVPVVPMLPQQQVPVVPVLPQQQVPVVPVLPQQQVPVVPVLPQQQVPVVPVLPQQQVPVVPKPLDLPEFNVVMSPIGSGVFKPEVGTRALPEPVKQIFLPPAATTAPPPQYGNVDALCHLDRMYVRIKKELFSKPGDAWQYLKIGTCEVNQATADHYYFLYYLKGCGLKYEEKEDYSTFSNTLTYNPPSTGPILRELPFSVNVLCKYYKHFYAYAHGYHPELRAGTVFAPLFPYSQFTLRPYDDKWEPLKPCHRFTIGKPMYFEAKVPPTNGAVRTYINQCFITPTSDPNANPRYTVIDNNGCMVDSKASTSSKFIPHADKTALRFSIGAFVFRDSAALPTGGRALYLHCEIIKGPVTPSPSLKSCTYCNKKWTELYDNTTSVCSCCEATCPSAVPADSRKMVSSDPWKLAMASEARLEKAAAVPDLIEADDLVDGFEKYWGS
ncbi:zona pellucida sperm-binding protein 3 isoform X1 [Alosa alosa]|uniref:zona pellucida sperm-binding protein 3 isoform X1 n=1 Tax=Alosa alosa TaxID=278164 RepID=UPI0020150903|nr:zona pellucida sperm-binding protein 3 isoform X1 [Alosa alosa]